MGLPTTIPATAYATSWQVLCPVTVSGAGPGESPVFSVGLLPAQVRLPFITFEPISSWSKVCRLLLIVTEPFT